MKFKMGPGIIEILTKTTCLRIIKEETQHRFDHLLTEVSYLRKKLRKIEEAITALKNGAGYKYPGILRNK